MTAQDDDNDAKRETPRRPGESDRDDRRGGARARPGGPEPRRRGDDDEGDLFDDVPV